MHLIKEEGSAGGPGEACGDELRSIGEDGVTVGTGEEACSTDVVEEDSPHCPVRFSGSHSIYCFKMQLVKKKKDANNISLQ